MLKLGQTTQGWHRLAGTFPPDSGPNFIVMDAGQLVWGLTQINKKENRREKVAGEKMLWAVSGSTHMADVINTVAKLT